ncbi:MAG: helix-turn-helix transcriptional regulator [Clostridia bacterium]|nr:helix-turn-helix transcriptional regulator [Clostridia bacterium]
MKEFDFGLRLAKLREQKGVSARDMSLSLGQNHSYINTIESGRALPSMAGFFYICEYLEISPKEFFDIGLSYPSELNEIIEGLKTLDSKELETVLMLIKTITSRK